MNLLEKSVGGMVEGFCLIKSADARTSKNGKLYLDLTLSDRGGEISAKLWDYIPELHTGYVGGSVVKVRAAVTEWQGSKQLKVERIRLATEADGVDMSELVSSAPVPGEKLYQNLTDTVRAFSDLHLQRIVLHLLEQNKQKLLVAPAALRMHHAFLAGVLYHTSSMLACAKAVCSVYTWLDADLVFAGIILHDLAKVRELEYNDAGVPSGYTAWGNLVGHLVGGALLLENAARECGTPDELKMKLQHMVISHHGKPEHGAAVVPMFPEAEVVSHIDELDATLFQMSKTLAEVQPGECSQRAFGLDRKLYRQDKDEEYNPKLF